jgi:hypothetical protein
VVQRRGRTVSNRPLRVAGAILSTLALLLQVGCYETLPLQQGSPPTTVSVQLVLNDAGRAAVSSKLGSAVDKVEGMLTAQNADSYTLAVSQVFQLGGSSTKWNGESVTVSKDWTVGYQIHRFSKSKTIILASAIVAAAIVFFVTTGLIGSGSPDDSGTIKSGGVTH